MKIQIKDLEPNPFRDMKNYPIDESKVQGLINSINETGFWNNLLARRHPDKADKFQIAYGHHRLLAIQKSLGKEAIVDIPIQPLSDETMLRIMAEENNEYYKTDVGVIDETVRVTFEFLKSFYSLGNKRSGDTRGRSHQYFKGLPEPPSTGESRYHNSVVAKQISNWIGKNWPEKRIHESLERKKLYDKDELDKSVEKLSQTSAGHFTRMVRKFEPTKNQQKKISDRIIANQDFSAQKIEEEFLCEKYGGEKPASDNRIKEFEDYIKECAQKIKSINPKISILLEFKRDFHSEVYQKSFSRFDFIMSAKTLQQRLKILLGGTNEKEKNRTCTLPVHQKKS